ncbi:hypothetical protein [Nostoc sp.]|uniref:hypothetical protein n=1 Tax=Nostoc sp. TaxID=1180 RepID=UPI002FF9FB3A
MHFQPTEVGKASCRQASALGGSTDLYSYGEASYAQRLPKEEATGVRFITALLTELKTAKLF